MTQEVLVPVAVPKKLDSPQVQLIDKVVNVPVTAQRTGPIRSESSEDRGDASGAVIGRRGGHASHHTMSGAHDPERAEDC